ncbi:TPA: hypothetical protein N0F65_013019 [Lagenidium giganteum]|uniref:Late endosomal/lysosomal adaptor and MAPK and MTOR activator 5 n=1 Tax=Lagenidium giganteum TaxID=4803 RepID=A0AAV2YKD3_9STRA|nr:TPA: hypothetical protein N0F65_013019 [Lagenidium giganteum]
MNDMRGVLLNDENGLCIKADGDLKAVAERNNAGFFSSMVEKAALLAGNDNDAETDAAPVVRLETTTRTLLISELETDGKFQALVVSKSKAALEDA